jgi:mannose-6-phosphate isomerase-like protein (cupin superfamily)
MLQQSRVSPLSDWMESRVALKSTRRYDWDALKFQADFDPQIPPRPNALCRHGRRRVWPKTAIPCPLAHFTFSTMVIPAGGIGPSHIHYDVEEIFFVIARDHEGDLRKGR